MFVGGQLWDERESRKELKHMDADTGVSTHVRRYPIMVAASGDLESRALERIHVRITDPTLYDGIRPSHRTAHLRCEIFRLASSTGCQLEEVRAAKMKCPNQIFRSIEDPTELYELRIISKESPCLMDAYVKDFLAYYPEGCNESDARADLLDTASLEAEDTVRIERLWSWVRRALTTATSNTWSKHMRDLNASWIGCMFKPYEKLRRRTEKSKKEKEIGNNPFRDPDAEPQPAAELDGKEHDGPPEKKIRKTQPLRGFNVFFSEATAGSDHSADFNELWEKWTQLPDDKKAEYKAKAKEKTDEVKAGVSAFPMRKREVQREIRIAAVHKALQDAPDELRSVGSASDTTLAIAPDEFCVAHQTDLKSLPMMQRALRVESHIEKQASDDGRSEVLDFQLDNNKGGQAVDRHLPDVQANDDFNGSLHGTTQSTALGPQRHDFIKWMPLQIPDLAANLACLNPHLKLAKPLNAVLDAVYEHANATIEHRRVPEVENEPPNTPCYDANVCLCSPSGKNSRHLRIADRFVCGTRSTEEKKSPENIEAKRWLTKSYVVLNLIGQTVTDEEDLS